MKKVTWTPDYEMTMARAARKIEWHVRRAGMGGDLARTEALRKAYRKVEDSRVSYVNALRELKQIL